MIFLSKTGRHRFDLSWHLSHLTAKESRIPETNAGEVFFTCQRGNRQGLWHIEGKDGL